MTGGIASAPGKPSPGVFKDNFVHLGGDEVNTDCWTKTPSVAAWLAGRNMSADDGYAYFAKRVAEMAIKCVVRHAPAAHRPPPVPRLHSLFLFPSLFLSVSPLL